MDVVEVDVDDNVEHVAENTPYITLIHTWRSRGAHHRPHTYDVCLARRIQNRGQLHYRIDSRYRVPTSAYIGIWTCILSAHILGAGV